MKIKKIIIRLLSVSLVAYIAILIGAVCWKHIRLSSKTTDKSYLNKIPRLEDSLVDTIEAEGLKIDMVSCVYDKETNVGISLFAIQGSGGEAECWDAAEVECRDDGVVYWHDGAGPVVYNGDYYTLQLPTAAGLSYRSEVQDGVLYQYFAYEVDFQEDDENYIGLYNYDDLDNEIAKFELKDEYASDKVMYFGDDSKITLSSVGIKTEVDRGGDDISVGIKTEVDRGEDDIILKYSNGKQRVIEYPSVFSCGNTVRVQFHKMIDIDGVTSIMYGGSEYEISKQQN